MKNPKFCTLCRNPMVYASTIWRCTHCDTTKCTPSTCGACQMAREHLYDHPQDDDGQAPVPVAA